MTSPSKRSEHPTRLALIEAAETLFAAGGYSGVSLRSIAAAADVQLGVIPYHFGSKATLYRAIWQHWMSRISTPPLLEAIAQDRAASTDQRVRALVRAFFHGPRQLLQDPRGRRFVAVMVREAHDPLRDERGLLAEFIYPNGNAVRDAVRDVFPTMSAEAFDIAFEMMVSGLRVVLEHGSADGRHIPDGAEADRAFDLLTEFVTHGWLAFERTA